MQQFTTSLVQTHTHTGTPGVYFTFWPCLPAEHSRWDTSGPNVNTHTGRFHGLAPVSTASTTSVGDINCERRFRDSPLSSSVLPRAADTALGRIKRPGATSWRRIEPRQTPWRRNCPVRETRLCPMIGRWLDQPAAQFSSSFFSF